MTIFFHSFSKVQIIVAINGFIILCFFVLFIESVYADKCTIVVTNIHESYPWGVANIHNVTGVVGVERNDVNGELTSYSAVIPLGTLYKNICTGAVVLHQLIDGVWIQKDYVVSCSWWTKAAIEGLVTDGPRPFPNRSVNGVTAYFGTDYCRNCTSARSAKISECHDEENVDWSTWNAEKCTGASCFLLHENNYGQPCPPNQCCQ